MKYRVADLEGAMLDRAVAKAVGVAVSLWGESPVIEGRRGVPGSNVTAWSPSTDWSQGGPLIDSERILFGETNSDEIGAKLSAWADEFDGIGPTHLIAAMRVIVALKIGEEIEL